MKKDWDIESISHSFLIAAQMSENYLNEIKPKLSSRPTYELLFDEHLATFYVYNYLHGRTFLESKNSLLNELSRMKENPNIASEAIDKERYLNFYIKIIDSIISGLRK